MEWLCNLTAVQGRFPDDQKSSICVFCYQFSKKIQWNVGHTEQQSFWSTQLNARMCVEWRIREGRLNQWAHWARARGPRFFFFLGGPGPLKVRQISESNYVIYLVLLLSYMIAFTNTSSSSAKPYKFLNCLALCMVQDWGIGILLGYNNHHMPTNCTGKRSFSKMKIIKNHLKSCMLWPRVISYINKHSLTYWYYTGLLFSTVDAHW